MNAPCSEIVGWFKRKPGRLGVLLAVSLFPLCAHGTDAFWINTGSIDFPPQIDASNFVNSGTINIATFLPFETSNTHNFTNTGTMTGQVGWLLDNSPANNGQRRLADNIVNLNPGVIAGLDGSGFITTNGGGGSSISLFPSYLFASASNIVNKGLMSVGGNGWLKLIGTNINLSRGALEVTGINPHGSVNNFPQTNFLPDVAISDVWWAQTNGFTQQNPINPALGIFDSSVIWDGAIARTPVHQVERAPGAIIQNVAFSISPSLADSFTRVLAVVPVTLTNIDGSTTNLLVPTNMVKQAVFVSVPADMSVAATFLRSPIFNNPYQTISVELALTEPDVINGGSSITTVYFYDTLASDTRRGLLGNVDAPALPPYQGQRPANYVLSRIDDGRFAAGQAGMGVPDPLYFADPATFSSLVVTSEYSGYHAFIDNLVSEPPAIAAGTSTNFPGRIQIFADNLDLRQTRVRGEGEVRIKANHLIGSAGALVDSENVSYYLGSTNGDLKVVDLAKTSVTRLKGDLLAWSGIWTNQMALIFTNNYIVTIDTNGVTTVTNATQSPVTNFISIGEHALILDGSGLAVHLPVITWDFATFSTNVEVSDNLAVVQTLLINGLSLTIDGGLTLSNTTVRSAVGPVFNFALTDWVGTNAPNLLFLTNNGTLTIPSEAHFGDDRPIPYTDFVNLGTLNAGGINIDSTYIESDGIISASVGPLDFVGATGLFQGGQSTSRGDIDFELAGLKFNNHQMSAVGTLNFTVTDALSDAGASSGNVFRMQNGFNLSVKPNSGDLLGTTFQDQPPRFVEVDHVWAGQDRGANSSGFVDNTALGKLILTATSTDPFDRPFFVFRGAGGQNAMYVDLLDLTSLGTNLTDMIEIDPNLTIYFASATLGFTPPPNAFGVPQEPEEFLDGQFGGHLRWVSSFAGPNSSVDVIINGVTVSVNRALRFSKIIDSNGNGVPNFFDPFPFNSVPLTLQAAVIPTNPPPTGAVGVSWKTSPLTIYQVEYSTDMHNPVWKPLLRYTNSGALSSTTTVWDTNTPAGAQRFYRVKATH
jgi:hypothetical protein